MTVQPLYRGTGRADRAKHGPARGIFRVRRGIFPIPPITVRDGGHITRLGAGALVQPACGTEPADAPGVLRNALLPVVTMLGMDIGIALGGAIFTEYIFGLPGLGRLAVQALENFDLPMIQGVVVFSTLCIIVFNVMVDVAYAFIDPRIRLN